jgi:hypothetical protein
MRTNPVPLLAAAAILWVAAGAPTVDTRAISTGAAETLTPSNERSQDEPVTDSNWPQHPKIKQVRVIVDSVNLGIRKGTLKVSKREFECCESYEDTLRKMAVDAKGVVRMYENQAGSDDSALTWQHYYDEAGRLRFVFISGGAASGAQLEHRIYFDETGKRLWEKQKYVKGPEYYWPDVWPEEKNDQARPIQKFEPGKAFLAPSPCPKKKSR